MIWFWVLIAGVVTFLTRYSMITFINPKTLSKTSKEVLKYVPSAVFPAIIFPAIFLDQEGYFLNSNSPQIWGFLIAVIFGYFFNNIIVIYFTLEFEKPIIIARIRKITVALLVVKKLPVLLTGKNSKKIIKKKGAV